MNIEEIRNRNREMKEQLMCRVRETDISSLVDALRNQERRDQKQLIFRRIVPLSVGFGAVAVFVAVDGYHSPLSIAGLIVMLVSIAISLVLTLREYSVLYGSASHAGTSAFLITQERRLRLMGSTRLRYHLVYAWFLIGYVVMNVGNLHSMSGIERTPFIIVVVCCTVVMIASWVIGGIMVRKRFRRDHKPLLSTIEDLQQ